MKISSSDGNFRDSYRTINGHYPVSHLIVLCCLLVLINLSIIWISVKECHSSFFLVPVLLMLATFKLIWDNNNRLFSLIVVFLTTAVFLVLYSNLLETRYQQQLRLIYNILHIDDAAYSYQKRQPLETAEVKPAQIDDGQALNIFFIETNHKKEVLTYRELCAIESAAKHNPEARVKVLTMNAKAELYNSTFNGSGGPELLDAYKNIEIGRLEPSVLFRSTPLLSWWTKGRWSVSPYILAHVSDAARLALLYKYGGFYSDLDTITIKSLNPVAKFSSVGHMVERRGDSLGNGVMSFEKSHPLLRNIMTTFEKEYDPFAWSRTGPVLVEKELKKYCHNDHIYSSQLIDQPTFDRLTALAESSSSADPPKWRTFKYSNNDSRQCDVLIYPKPFYYPFDYRFDLKQLFETNGRVAISKLIHTFSVHFYGKLSSKYRVHIGDSSLYEYLAINHCPVVYESVKTQRLFFN